MTLEIPEDGPEFEAMMREVDAALMRRGVAITARPLSAAGEISLKYGVDFPIFDPGPKAPPELRRFGALCERVHAWFEDAYGDRLKVDPSPGRIVIDIDGDLYALRLPRFLGQGEFVISRRFFPTELGVNRPFRSNILQLVDHMTEAKAALISRDAMQSIFTLFPIALRSHYDLESSSESDLIRIARSDLDTAAEKLLSRGEHYGESKWASLQATEKCFKAAISLAGAQYRQGHTLDALVRDLRDLSIIVSAPTLTASIQCRGGIRYGEETCTRDEAIAAHHASFQLICQLIAAGAKFQSELSITKLGTGTYAATKSIAPRRRRQ